MNTNALYIEEYALLIKVNGRGGKCVVFISNKSANCAINMG